MFVTISTIGVFKTVPRKLDYNFQEGITIYEMIKHIGADYPEFQEILNSPAADGVVVLLNGQSVFLQNGFYTPLKNGDDIFIAPMTHGG